MNNIISTVNEWQYDEIVDSYRECNHGIKVLKLNDMLDVLQQKIDYYQSMIDEGKIEVIGPVIIGVLNDLRKGLLK